MAGSLVGRLAQMHAHPVIVEGREKLKEQESLCDQPEDDGNYVELSVLYGRASQEKSKTEVRRENYLDFYKKYDKVTKQVELSAATIDLGPCTFSWCLVFELKEFEGVLSAPRECVDTCLRLWAADVEIKLTTGASQEELYVQVGCAYEVLVDEASVLKPMMRLQATKGCVEFKSEFIPHFAVSQFVADPCTAHCFTSGLCQRLTWNRMARVAGLDLEENEHMLPRAKSLQYMKDQLEDNGTIRANRVRDLLVTHGGFRPNCASILGEEVEELADQVLAEPLFSCDADHVLTPTEQAILHAEEEHMRDRGLNPVKYIGIKRVVSILDEWTSKEPGASEIYSGTLKLYFAMHDESELEYLQHIWAPFSMMWEGWITGKNPESKDTLTYYLEPVDSRQWSTFYVPVDSVRDYFGDQVGLYAVWLSIYTRSLVSPAMLGLFVIMNGWNVDDNALVMPFSMFLCIWSAVFITTWKRKESELAFLWGSEMVEESAPVRRQFRGVQERNEETGVDHVVAESTTAQFVKLALSTCTSITLIISVMLAAFMATLVQYHERIPLCFDHGDASYFEAHYPACARCESTFLVPVTVGVNETLNPLANIGFIRDVYTNYECEQTCDDVSDARCRNVNGTNIWHDGWHDDASLVDKNRWKWISAFLNTAMIVVFGAIYEKVATSLNEWENHRTQIEYDDNLILKNFMFQFVNNYFVLFYIAYMRQVEVPGVNVDAECKSGSCMGQLQIQVGVVFTMKTLFAQLMEIAGPSLKQIARRLVQMLHIKKMQRMVGKIVVDIEQMALPENLERAAGVDSETIDRSRGLQFKKDLLEVRLAEAQAAEAKREEGSLDYVEDQSYLEEYDSTFEDFNEMVIQFGYLALFSPAYPLAPFLALLNNILEIRVDANKLCCNFRRPAFELAEDIGSWTTVISIMGFVAVIANATMVTFVAKRVSQQDGWAATTNEDLGGMDARLQNWRLWAMAVGIEHSVMLVRVLILVFVPNVPRWLDDARDVLAHKRKNMKPATQMEEERALHVQFKERYGVRDDLNQANSDNLESLTMSNIRSHMEGEKRAKTRLAEEKRQAKAVRNGAHSPTANAAKSERLVVVSPMLDSAKPASSRAAVDSSPKGKVTHNPMNEGLLAGSNPMVADDATAADVNISSVAPGGETSGLEAPGGKPGKKAVKKKGRGARRANKVKVKNPMSQGLVMNNPMAEDYVEESEGQEKEEDKPAHRQHGMSRHYH